MTATATPTKMNNQPRKTLSEQLDRLDEILDGLSDGLNEAVAQAVGTAVRQAVEAALTELVTNPELRAKLQSPAAAQPTQSAAAKPAEGPSLLRRAWNWIRQTVRDVASRVRSTVASCVSALWSLPSRATKLVRLVIVLAWENRSAVAVAVAAGAAVGIGCYLAGPAIAAAVGGLTAGAVAFGARLFAPVFRVLFEATECVV